jgi:hypothetical protein
MRDHVRIAAGLLVAWAPIQIVASLTFAWFFSRGPPWGAAGTMFWLLTAVVAAGCAIVGGLLWRHDARARPWGVALGTVLVYFFPVGTFVGTYVLWALVRMEPAQA